MSDYVDCDLWHGPRKAGTRCKECDALKNVPLLKAELAALRAERDGLNDYSTKLADKLSLCQHERDRYREALEYIVSKAQFVGKSKWDAEFVDAARTALGGEGGGNG